MLGPHPLRMLHLQILAKIKSRFSSMRVLFGVHLLQKCTFPKVGRWVERIAPHFPSDGGSHATAPLNTSPARLAWGLEEAGEERRTRITPARRLRRFWLILWGLLMQS